MFPNADENTKQALAPLVGEIIVGTTIATSFTLHINADNDQIRTLINQYDATKDIPSSEKARNEIIDELVDTADERNNLQDTIIAWLEDNLTTVLQQHINHPLLRMEISDVDAQMVE